MKNKNLKIAFLIADKHDGKGGLENVLIDIVQGLKSHDIDSYIALIEEPVYQDILTHFSNIKTFSTSENLALKKKKPTFLYRLLWKYNNRRILKKYFTTLQKFQPDALILINFPEKFIRHYSLFKKYKQNNPKTALIAWPHGSLSILGNKISKMLKERISLFDDIFAISKGIQNELKEIYKIQQSTLIYNPIKKANIITRQTNRFIYIGRIDAPEKRVKSLLKILSQLQGEWRLDLYGSLGSNDESEAMKEYISSLNLSSKIYCHGWVNDPWSQIPKAGVLLLNSSSEGFGLVLAEAMMRGIPCVSSDCPVGPNEIIQHGVNGWLYSPNKEGDCLQILQAIIDGELSLPTPLVIQNSVKKFTSEVVIQNFITALEKNITKKNHTHSLPQKEKDQNV